MGGRVCRSTGQDTRREAARGCTQDRTGTVAAERWPPMWHLQRLLLWKTCKHGPSRLSWGSGAGRRAAMTPTKKKRAPVAEDGAVWPCKRRNALEDSARGMHGERAKVLRADEALAKEAEAALAQAESVRADSEPRSLPLGSAQVRVAT